MLQTEDETALEEGINTLRLLCIWPRKNCKRTDVSTILGYIFVALYFPICLIGSTWYIIYITTSGVFYLFPDLLAGIVPTISGVYFCLYISCLLWNQPTILKLIKHLTDFETFGKPQHFDSLVKKLNILPKVAALYVCIATTTVMGMLYVNRKECLAMTKKYDMYNICAFIFPVYYPVEMTVRNITLISIISYTSATLICASGLSITGLATVIIELLVMRVNHFKEIIDEGFEGKTFKEMEKYVKHLVNYHVELIVMNAEIVEALGGIITLLIVFSSIVIGIIAFQCMCQLSVKNVTHLMGYLLILSFPCASGQRLIDSSEEIPFRLYSMSWYNVDISLQKNIWFAILRSNYQLEIKPYYGMLSMVTFGSVIQSAYSFIAMLSQTYDFDKNNLPTLSDDLNSTMI